MQMRPHIYNVYGLVRLADEIVDSYTGSDAELLLDGLEKEVYEALYRGFSANFIVHAFVSTARKYAITRELIEPFFASMRLDIDTQTYTESLYMTYIYGSAEVVGLMCLKVFCEGDETQYYLLQSGAQRLGAAYQKINFLRDMAQDSAQLGRFYFPGYTIQSFDNDAKNAVILEIRQDLSVAAPKLLQLPKKVHVAVGISSAYYSALLLRLERTSVDIIKTKRLRVPTLQKVWLSVGVVVKGLFA